MKPFKFSKKKREQLWNAKHHSGDIERRNVMNRTDFTLAEKNRIFALRAAGRKRTANNLQATIKSSRNMAKRFGTKEEAIRGLRNIGKTEKEIREIMPGTSPEFIKRCCRKYQIRYRSAPRLS